MGFNVIKRVSDLRKQVDESQVGRWKLFRVTFLSFLGLSLFSLLFLPAHRDLPQIDESLSPAEAETQERLHEVYANYRKISRQFEEQLAWLKQSPLALVPGAASRYEALGKGMVAAVKPQNVTLSEDPEDEEFSSFSFAGFKQWFVEFFVGTGLRLLFVTLAYWPLWFVAGIVGYFFTRNRVAASGMDTMLSVLDRKTGPFYSGIYGPLRPNNSFSGTDLSSPSLACPPEIPRNEAVTHKLVSMLKAYGALNETTLHLVQVILAHRAFPGTVPEENPIQAHDEERENHVPELDDDQFNQKGYIVSAGGHTVEASTLQGLSAVLEAHKRLSHYRTTLDQKNIKPAALNKNYPSHIANVKKLCAGLSPLGQLLAVTLTPNRMWAIGQMSPVAVAATYLAIEAGKSLVYKRHGDGFSQISNYPHLQARAVIQSIASYHTEFNGDTRLIMRQAIICARRHGDFGRSFLPIRMTIESRALRDWLEILYAEPDKRQQAASLVELDTHIEEIGVNWRAGFVGQLKQFRKDSVVPEVTVQAQARGLPHKSVLLMPVDRVVHLGLRGFHPQRKRRITELLDETRSYQAHLNISARLPGFKRQAMEAERSGDDSDSILQQIAANTGGSEVIEEWRIVRRMLTRFNWLSTRVGDDAVPLAGLVQGVVTIGGKDSRVQPNDKNTTRFESLVPLRQRRLSELLGKHWERIHFAGAPHSEEIEIFASPDALEVALARVARLSEERPALEGFDESLDLESEEESDSPPTRSVISGGS